MPSKSAPTQDIDEQWFPGCHCDVGGGYAPDATGMWQAPFEWMVRESSKFGLRIADARLAEVLRPPTGAAPGWIDAVEDSLRWFWTPAEFFPKAVGDPRKAFFNRISVNLFRRRTVQAGARIHRATLERLRRADLGYRPSNLSAAFVARVRALSEVPEFLTYEP